MQRGAKEKFQSYAPCASQSPVGPWWNATGERPLLAGGRHDILVSKMKRLFSWTLALVAMAELASASAVETYLKCLDAPPSSQASEPKACCGLESGPGSQCGQEEPSAQGSLRASCCRIDIQSTHEAATLHLKKEERQGHAVLAAGPCEGDRASGPQRGRTVELAPGPSRCGADRFFTPLRI